MRTLWDSRPARWAVAVAWMGFIFYLSSLPNIPYLGHGWYTALRDVAGHFTVYAILALLLERALAGGGSPRLSLRDSALRGAFIIAVIYGISDEFHQSFVPGRAPDVFDVLTDAAGAAFALWMLARWRLRRARLAAAEASV